MGRRRIVLLVLGLLDHLGSHGISFGLCLLSVWHASSIRPLGPSNDRYDGAVDDMAYVDGDRTRAKRSLWRRTLWTILGMVITLIVFALVFAQ